MRVVIINTYSWFNKGDTAIVMGTVRALRKSWPDASISIVSMTPDDDEPHYAHEAVTVCAGPFGLVYNQTLPSFVRVALFALGCIALFVALAASRVLKRLALYWLPRPVRAVALAIYEADLAVSCGGGFWQDSWGNIVFFHLIQVVAALVAGTPVVCLGQSIGPFYDPYRLRLVGMVLRHCTAVVIRETESLAVVRAMRIPLDRVHVGADMAFALDLGRPKPAQKLRTAERLRIGVTARQWSFPHSTDPRAAQEKYEQALVETLEYLITIRDADVYFLPQVIGPGVDDDRIVERRLAARLSRTDRVHVIEDDCSPDELMSCIGTMDLMLATRFHSAIFSMLARVPVVAIAYEHKTTGIMGRMGLGNWATPIEMVTGRQLIDLIERMIEERMEVRAMLTLRVSEECQRAFESIAICRNGLVLTSS